MAHQRIDSLAAQAKAIPLLDQTASDPLESRGESHDHDHHDHDPHAWLDPQIAINWLDHIRDQLMQTDPENAATYEENARLTKERLSSMSRKITADYAEFSSGSHFASHDSYQYFERQFGLTLIG